MKTIMENQSNVEEALKLENQLYIDLSNALPCGIYRLRVYHLLSFNEEKWLSANDAPYIVEFANDQFYQILHQKRDVYEKNPGVIHDLILDEDKAEFARLNVESNLYIIPFYWEGRFLIEGKIIWIRLTSIPRVLENKDIIWTGTLEDITLRKQYEAEILQKKAELEKINAGKDFFMSILAHNLKSPFTSILGFLELLTRNLYKYDQSEIEKQLTLVNHSAHYTYNLLEDILSWSLSQSGKLPFLPTNLNLRDTCDQVVELVKSNADIKNISVINEIEKDFMVFADINWANTILRNLISNAIKFTVTGGKVKIYAEEFNSEIIISISDSGIGIEPEKLATLFEDSQIYSIKGTANEKGAGFGLMLCKNFVNQHGGKIWAESTLNEGSIFKFTLPKG